MKRNDINYVNFNTAKGKAKRPGNKTKERIVMAAGGIVIFILTFFIYGIMDNPERSGEKDIVTENRDILAQIDQLEEQRRKKEEKLGMIKNDVFLGKNTDVDEYTASLLNDLKNLAEKNNEGSEKSMKIDDEDIFSNSHSDEHMNSILSYLEEEEEDPKSIFDPDLNKEGPVSGKYRYRKSEKKVRSLFAFSNTWRSARIYNNGSANVSPVISERNDTINRLEKNDSGTLCLIFNSNPVFTICEGEILTASLTCRVVNDKRESPVTAVTSKDFLDNSGRFVLLPANSRVTGYARKVSGQQDARIFIDFHRIILPNGRSIDMGSSKKSMAAMDRSGALGIRGKRNNHFFTKFGSSILYGSLNGLSGFAQNSLDQSSGLSRFIDRTSDNFNILNERLASDSLAIVPTIVIKAGTEFNIRFASDVRISAYSRVSERTYY